MTNQVNKSYLIAVWCMMFAYVAVLFTSLCIRFYSFDFYDLDLAFYDQVIWQLPQGDFYNRLLGIHFLGLHAHFLTFPLAIIYKVLPHPLTLLFIQTVCMALGAYPLFLIALRVLGAPLALLVSACYLLYPGLIFTNAYEFHHPPFAILGLLCVCYFYYENRYRPYLLAALITLLIQENLSLVLFSFGLYAMIQRRSLKWWLPLMVVSAAYFVFCIKFMLPKLNPNVIQFTMIYEYFGNSYWEIIVNIFTHPVKTLEYMFTIEKSYWLFQLFLPLLLLPLLSPVHLLPILPIFLQRLLSFRPQEIDISFHYTSELIPFIFLAYVFGLKRISALKYFQSRRSVLIGSVLCVALWAGFQTKAFTRVSKPFYSGIDHSDQLRGEMIRHVPPEAPLVTTFQFMPHMNHRKEFYSFHHIYTMKYMLSQKDYDLPPKIEYALIDFNDPLTVGSFYEPSQYKNIITMLNHYKLSPIMAVDNMVLFQSGVEAKTVLFEVLDESVAAGEGQPLFEYDGVGMLAADAQLLDEQTLKVTMDWKAVETTGHDISLYFRLIDANGTERQHHTSTVCYRIFPTQAWRPGQRIRDYRYVSIAPYLWNKIVAVKIGFYDQDGFATLGKEILLEIAPTPGPTGR